jgi:hypothetical protein
VGRGGGCSERSIMMRLQMSRSAFAMLRAGASHRNTWHMCLRVARSRATYAKSLPPLQLQIIFLYSLLFFDQNAYK